MLPPFLYQGLITLILKPKKELLLIENWRPISLLDTDYKIIALVLAKRLKRVLNNIIDECPLGFINHRYISNNIRLIFDLLDYSDLVSTDSFILFLDYYKAFDCPYVKVKARGPDPARERVFSGPPGLFIYY